MKVPINWLKTLVDPGASTADIAHRLTMAGLEVEKIEEIGADWDNVFVGFVHGVSPHPDADRLVLADVEAGAHRLTVVTGAPNIAADQKVALAIAGANLIDGYSDSGQRRILKPAKMRGILSEGMVCSEKELGLSDEHEGIMVLEADAPLGAPLADHLGDIVLELEITPNLVHCFSVEGIAREIAALYDLKATKLPAATAQELGPRIDGVVTVEATALCPRYMGMVIEGLTVEPSPAWMTRRLTAAGIRPINNIVDITNYVMLETGQPLHAFDMDKLTDQRIVVRTAQVGESLETLDHQVRKLTVDMLVIADAHVPVGIAGVMGGASSEVSDATTSIILEGANFDMKSVRHTARDLKLRTDASARFERGVDPNLVEQAIARATRLLIDLCPGAVVRGHADHYPAPLEPRHVSMAYSRFEQVLGIEIDRDDILAVLGRLGFDAEFNGVERSTLTVAIPTFRSDVSLNDDIVEEVARIIGYDALPATLPVGQTAPVNRDPVYALQSRLRRVALGSGLSEAVTYVTVTSNDLTHFHSEERGGVGLIASVPESEVLRLRNPLQADRDLLRVTIVPSLLEPLANNLKHAASVGLFEFGRLFLPAGEGRLPDELDALAIVMAGQREPFSIYSGNDGYDFFDLRGVVEVILEHAGLEQATMSPLSHPALHSGRAAEIRKADSVLGVLGELDPDVAREFGLVGVRVNVAELNLRSVMDCARQEKREAQVPRYLPVRQDFAVVVAEETPAGNVAAALRSGGGPLVSSVDLFDIYRGDQVGELRKSLAYRVTFTAPDRTLTDNDIIKVRKRIEKVLTQEVGGVLRS
ncbi:phenylalanine--tRNA ligase subunit beta [soil metagenome]